MKEYLTACPRNCYSTCSFIVQERDNEIIRILPDKDNMATPEGPCIKGLSYLERAAAADRIIKPLLRKNDGTFKEIETGDALNILTEKLEYFKSNYGNKSILYYTGSGASGLSNEIGFSFWKAFGGASLTYGNFCWPAGLEAVRLTLGEIKQNIPWDIENASLIIIWGKNPAETNVQEMAFIDRAKKKGCKVVNIDPRRTATSDKSDILYQLRPGTDAALALAIASVLIEQDLIDRKFITQYVRGFDEFSSSLKIKPKEASEITGIPEGDIYDLALSIGHIKPMTILPGYGMQRYTNGGQTIRALLALNILTGNIGKKGAGFNYANMQGYVFDSTKEPLSYYPWINESELFRRTISVARLGDDIINTKDPGIKMAWIERGNPFTQAPDTNKLEDAFRNIDFTLVIDQFMTDSARKADLVLPAKNMFEQQDIFSSYWSPYIFYRPAILHPPDTVLSEARIYYELAKRLNIDYKTANIPEPGIENMDIWLDKRISNKTELSLSDLKSGKKLAPGIQHIAYEDMTFKTVSGKIELSSDDAKRIWKCSKNPSYDKAFLEENGSEHRFCFMSPNTHYRIHSQFGNLDVIKRYDPEPALTIAVSDALEMDIKQGDPVRVYNNRGEIILKVNISRRIRKGCVSLPNGWWKAEGGGGNQLSAGRETDMGHGTAFHDNMVSIEKIT